MYSEAHADSVDVMTKMPEQKFVTESAEATLQAGERLAESLGPGDVVALFGDLGSGKTVFIKGVCRGLGVAEEATSPTFTLIHEYRGRCDVYHFDFYRIHDRDELLGLGFEEYFERDGVCLIEWADRIAEFLPQRRYEVFLRHPPGRGDPNMRELEIRQP